MFKKNKIYKIKTTENLYFTGKVVEEDNILIRINTIRGEDRVINKNKIADSMELVWNEGNDRC